MLPDDRLPPFEPNIAGVVYLPLTGEDFDIVMWSIVSGVAFIARRRRVPPPPPLVSPRTRGPVGAASINASSMAAEVHDRWVMELLPVDASTPRPTRDG